MLCINTQSSRYFKRDPKTAKWDLSAYDEVLLSGKYSLDEFRRFFATLDLIPPPPEHACCKTRPRNADSDYNMNLHEMVTEENNRVARRGLFWERRIDTGDAAGEWWKTIFLKLNITDPNHPPIPAGFGNPLMPFKI